MAQPLTRPAYVLFDLDGTLLDTAPDMGRALNRLLAEHGSPELDAATIRPVVSHGSLGLLKLGFDLNPDDAAFDTLRERFLTLYEADLALETVLFEGMAEVLARLEQENIPWGIVTNKPGGLTTPLLQQLDLVQRAACVVSGDTLAQRKPDPAPLFYACEQLGLNPATGFYVGDAERDIEAARRAGMPSLVAAYGYLHPNEQPETWGAEGVLQSPLDLLDWLALGA